MRFDILTLFPEMCETVLGESIIGRARAKGALDCRCHNFRDYAEDKHNRVDDSPYGGGRGMLLKAAPIYRCWQHIVRESEGRPHTIYMSPQGKVFTQEKAAALSQKTHIIILCGHYEGVDERLLEKIVDEEISIGDYVLTGGELPAMILLDSVARLCKGVLAGEECFQEESLYNGLLEYPHYTRPEEWEGEKAPEVLLSGNHARISKWRRERSLERTCRKRPDLLKLARLSPEDKLYIQEKCGGGFL
ncbi:MAG: tRNA (guanosine(37)-N1)-methyltransferase TrmD [Oscillospiraceae bacterium]|jgi:tRNA (guanine37-N1)-methyltransferase|nr:tRNA (guanosine(37)-N1)-methyltransferase TrmD [Oscillospiraceae bacterium]